MVARELQARGWSLLASNWRGGGGELDLVVARDGAVRFVEVKSRSEAVLDPLSSITPSKQRKLTRAADAWMLAHLGPDIDEACFLVAIVNTAREPWCIDWFDNPFDGS